MIPHTTFLGPFYPVERFCYTSCFQRSSFRSQGDGCYAGKVRSFFLHYLRKRRYLCWGCAMLVHSPGKQLMLRNVCMNLLQQSSADETLPHVVFGWRCFVANGEPDNRFLRRDWSAGRGSEQHVQGFSKVNRAACCCEVVAHTTREPSHNRRISGVFGKVCFKVWRPQMTYISTWNRPCKLHQTAQVQQWCLTQWHSPFIWYKSNTISFARCTRCTNVGKGAPALLELHCFWHFAVIQSDLCTRGARLQTVVDVKVQTVIGLTAANKRSLTI